MDIVLEGLVEVQLAGGGVRQHAQRRHVHKALRQQEQVDAHLHPPATSLPFFCRPGSVCVMPCLTALGVLAQPLAALAFSPSADDFGSPACTMHGRLLLSCAARILAASEHTAGRRWVGAG